MQPITWNLRGLPAPAGEPIARILSAALEAVDPANAVKRAMQREGDRLTIGGRAYDLSRYQRVRLIGAGKAGAPMALAAAQILGDRLSDGLVVVKEGHTARIAGIPHFYLLEAGHPIPDWRSAEAAKRMTKLLSDTQAGELVICMISGGGSALLVSPAKDVSLADLQNLTHMLLASGAGIREINCLRKHLDQIKGGGLARLAAPAEMVTLILSDVVGDPLDMIASGPTVPDPTTFAEAWAALEEYDLDERVPAPIREHLKRGRRGLEPETLKPDDPRFEAVQNVIIGSNHQAAAAALEQARAEGFQPMLLTTFLEGEARQAGRCLASILRQIATSGQPLSRPACLVAGGETTVTLQGNGLGGRNQEMALGAVAELAGLPGVAMVTLATDGGDGPTDAAGALVTGETARRARDAGLDWRDYLHRNDSYHYFDILGDLLRTGPTRTNVNDLALFFAFGDQ